MTFRNMSKALPLQVARSPPTGIKPEHSDRVKIRTYSDENTT